MQQAAAAGTARTEDAAETWTSLPWMMLDLARRRPQAPMIRYWRGGAWRRLSWGEFALQVGSLAAWFRQQGIMPGDRVLLVSESRPEWNIADVALMAIGAVTVPTYVTNTVADHAHVIADSGARTAIVSIPSLAARLAEAAAGRLEQLLLLDAEGAAPPGIPSHRWADAVATPAELPLLLAEVEQIPPGRLACLIYTSGTGGLPRGVMLPHRAVLANRAGIAGFLERLQVAGTPYLSFLPLSHAYEHTVGCFLLPSCGMEIVYSRGADRLAAELTEIRPTLITAVPRLFELLRARMLAQLEKETPFRRRLFETALALGLRKLDGPPLGPLEAVQDWVLDRLVRNKVRARFGGRLKALVSGGARLDPDLSGFFLALGLPLLQGYGQSEAGPVISVNLPWDNVRHTVGKPLDGVQARIAEDGELLIRGPLVMDGYWGNAEATAAALRPGPDDGTWLHTGDVAHLEEGRIVITDRKRDFIKTLGGDMVSPAKVEGLLMAEPEIAQAVVAGEGQAGIVALVVPAEGMADKAGAAIARVNAKLSPIERIRRWCAAPAPFSVENGLLTPTMKVKRRAVLERYAGEIGALHR
ncbi:long-chain fatty acid--CoA ligase [Siccirubricoccus sp. KC 17139]|uniref:Long-chain fatty acid--CoA ligase n=1 Tax=Siccirubricoccus soli TaxID=2899147 RepID=A0ABT1DCU1_9PROT|nr:long-chain fatty acid--CoA ligase [Siccirubricoccus soli]MCO6419752.1 long-chain fatty acid--CoA ligase [Siccirubricoccus soli]MCP2685887.1 long-chain fatty acid--CoA ligase [Siccirubricoccus soli]